MREYLSRSFLLIIVLYISVFNMALDRVDSTNLSSNVLYVGGNGPGNYTSIQDAIDHASIGDTVFVYSGIYHEQIVIDKEIRVIGEERNTTIIDCDGMSDSINYSAVVNIYSDNVEFSGFTIQYNGETRPLNKLMGISINYGDLSYTARLSNIKISNNIVRSIGDSKVKMEYGIFFHNVDNSEINGNIIDGSYVGILLYLSSDNKISDNIVQNCGCYGIATLGSASDFLWEIILLPTTENNLIIDNILRNNREGIVIGQGSYNNMVTFNDARDNNIGVTLYYCVNNNVSKNNLFDNNRNGFIFATRTYHFYSNKWYKNYWGEKLDQAVIMGRRYFLLSGPIFIPLWTYDRYPADKPYNVGG